MDTPEVVNNVVFRINHLVGFLFHCWESRSRFSCVNTNGDFVIFLYNVIIVNILGVHWNKHISDL